MLYWLQFNEFPDTYQIKQKTQKPSTGEKSTWDCKQQVRVGKKEERKRKRKIFWNGMCFQRKGEKRNEGNRKITPTKGFLALELKLLKVSNLKFMRET